MFSTNMILSSLLLLFVVLVPTYWLYCYAKRFPAVYKSNEHKTGVSGIWLVFIVGEVAVFFRLLMQTVIFYQELVAMNSTVVNSIVVIAPSVISLALVTFMLYAIVVLRTPAALAGIVVSLWLVGPVFTLVQGWFFSMSVSTAALTEMFVWAAFWSAYIAMSPRIALTYGTKRGKRLAGQ